MEKTFNLRSYMEKTANMAYEGSQGYFLAQQRAWMNCSKCKRDNGKSAQEAWQDCFDEFQEGDRKMSWLENYASDEVQNVKKESAIDYSEEVIKLASSGLGIKDAVNTALQQRLAFDWPWNKNKQNTQNQTQQTPQNIDYEAQARQQAQQARQANPANPANPASGKVKTQTNQFTPEQLAMNEKRKQAVTLKNQNTKTYNILHQVSELIKQDVYDSDSIRKLISSIPNQEVKNRFLQIDNQVERVEANFTKMVDQMSAEAQNIMKTYQNSEFKSFFQQPKPQMGGDVAKQPAQKPQQTTAPLGQAASTKTRTKKS
jgi:hypothetical protein